MICAIYVDDIIFLSSNDINIDITISELWALTFDLTDKRGVESFLGIKTNTNDDGMITMSQHVLIDTMNPLGLEDDCKQHQISAVN